jgi:hypothetical protein
MTQTHRYPRRSILCVVSTLTTILLATAPSLLAQGNSVQHVPQVVVDADGSHMTPLAKGFTSTSQTHRVQARAAGNVNCVDPTSSDNAAQRRGKGAACNVADVAVINAPDSANCPDCGSNITTDATGNVVGTHLKNKVTVSFTNPSQRVDDNGNPLLAWPPLAINGNRIAPQPFQGPDGNMINPSNEDTSGNPIVTKFPDPASLSGNMTNAGAVDPRTSSVTQFHNNLSNVPLSGGDCSSFGSGKAVTTRDGTVTVTLPQQGFGVLNPDGTCDVSRAFIAAANLAAPMVNSNPNSMAFDTDANGNCNPNHSTSPNPNAAVGCGQERRTQRITEDYVAHCPPNAQYVNGVCFKPTSQSARYGGQKTFMHSDFYASLVPAALTNLTQDNAVIMGFTFAPPEISWGYSIDEDACVDLLVTEVCITLFSAKIGYDFDLATGLRLPVQLEASNIPPSILAGTAASLTTSLTPQDFTAADYTNFCVNNGVADGLLVSDCNTFAFPEFFSSLFHDVDSSVPIDGQEFVAKWVIFAGVKVVVLDVPVIDVGIDSAGDIPTLGTMFALWQNKLSATGATALAFLLDYKNAGATAGLNDFLTTLKAKDLNWASFTTPFGGVTNLDGSVVARKFPFLFADGLHLYADCVKAASKGQFIGVGGNTKPFCTGLFLSYAGATAGIGLTLIPTADSSQINASWGVGNDGRISGNADSTATSGLGFTQVVNNNTIGSGNVVVTNPDIGPIAFDNYDTTTDYAHVKVDNFTYLLNTFGIELDANLEFGGILAKIPDLPSFPILNLRYNAGSTGIPIPEHRGEKPIDYGIFVTNYGLSVSGSPVVTAVNPLLPASQNNLNPTKPALGIKPGRSSATFNVQIKNEGSVSGNFENFAAITPDMSGKFSFLTPGWAASFAQSTTSGNAHALAGSAIPVTITPLKDPSTRPQVYPITLQADSTEAVNFNMPATDPSNIKRKGAADVVYVNVLPYYDPRITSVPPSAVAKPGATAQAYAETVQNHGNAPDQIRLTYGAVDFNTAACTLTSLGGAGCQYRAVPTVIPPAWTTASGITTLFDAPLQSPPVGDVAVLATRNTGLTIAVPSTWAGMTNTTYTFAITVTSLIDDGAPPASNVVKIQQTVVATKQSMTRYIGLELTDLASQIQVANAAGIKTGGTLPIDVNASQGQNGKALNYILAGNFSGATSSLKSEISTMQAFLAALAGPNSIPTPYVSDWSKRANAIIVDLNAAVASTVTSN